MFGLLGPLAKVAATEELHEAGQRKIAGFAERTAAAERQTREVAARLRALESGQAALKVSRADICPHQPPRRDLLCRECVRPFFQLEKYGASFVSVHASFSLSRIRLAFG